MGFTAVDGLMMGTRTGNLDPGVLLYLMDYRKMDSKALTSLLYKESGLLGVSGISGDMRVLLESTAPEAREAIDLFCYRIVREIGSLAAGLGGLDALVFTGGIGEHSAAVRAQVCAQLGWLGVALDSAASAANAIMISAGDSGIDVCVIPTNEEWIIARHTARLLA
jgi:acetate kinase